MPGVDLNSDLGEGFGPYRIADDEALLEIVSSANIACGGHAGDPMVMDETVRRAAGRGVLVGGHVGYPDRVGFGRRSVAMTLKELELLTISQLGSLYAIARNAGARLSHANFHGALGNLSFVDRDVARTLIAAIKAFDPGLAFIGLPHTEAARQAEDQGLRVVRSFLADRAYTPEGTLVGRHVDGAVVRDCSTLKERVEKVLTLGVVDAIDGTQVPMQIDSILIHSDTSGAVELAQTIRSTVIASGFTVTHF